MIVLWFTPHVIKRMTEDTTTPHVIKRMTEDKENIILKRMTEDKENIILLPVVTPLPESYPSGRGP